MRRQEIQKQSAPGYTTRSSHLRRLGRGDEQAWCEFYEKYRGMICAVGAGMGLSADDIDDLLQEVTVICCRRLKSFIYTPERCRFRTFLYHVARNVSFNILRSRKRLSAGGLDVGDYESIPGLDLDFMKEYEDFLLEQSLKALERTVDSSTFLVFHLLVIEKKTIPEIVRLTGKTPGAVYSVKHRCLKKLDAIIAELAHLA